MKQDYFIYNGTKYNAGTILIVTDLRSVNHVNTMATFDFFNTETERYQLRINSRTESLTQQEFDKIYHGVWDGKYGLIKPIPASMPMRDILAKQKAHPKEHTFSDELKIQDLKIAWVLYIIAMLISFVFYERILAWIFVSIVFFSYRSKILKSYGYK